MTPGTVGADEVLLAASNCYTCRFAEGDLAEPGCRLLDVEGWADDVVSWRRSQAVPTNAVTHDGEVAMTLPASADGCPHWRPR